MLSHERHIAFILMWLDPAPDTERQAGLGELRIRMRVRIRIRNPAFP
jgi:hypothetical protein